MLNMLQLLQQVPHDNIPGAVWPIYTNGDIAYIVPPNMFRIFWLYLCLIFMMYFRFLGLKFAICMCVSVYFVIHIQCIDYLFDRIIHILWYYNSHIITVRKVICQSFWYTNICISYKFQHSKITRYTLIASMYVQVHVFCMYVHVFC